VEGWLGFSMGEVFGLVFGDDQIALLHICGSEFLVFVCAVFLELLKIIVYEKVIKLFVVVFCLYDDTRLPLVCLHDCCVFVFEFGYYGF
jgi:hypothetical protein